jgi:amidase
MIRRYRLTAIAFEATGCTAPPLPGIIDRSWHCKDADPQPLKWGKGGGSIGPLLSPITGLPVLTIPTGRLPDDLPASINLLGPAWSEGPLLRLGFAFQQPPRAGLG